MITMDNCERGKSGHYLCKPLFNIVNGLGKTFYFHILLLLLLLSFSVMVMFLVVDDGGDGVCVCVSNVD